MSDELRGGVLTERDSFGDWWKLVVAGPLIIMVVIIGGSLGVEAWFVAFGAVVFAGLLTALGLILGLARLWTRRAAV